MKIICGDCLEIAKTISKESVNLIVTSPPYAQQRKKQYGGIPKQNYPDWTVKWCDAFKPALTNNGSIAIVIRPHIHQGQISDYVLHTRLALRENNWIEAEELIWIKPNSPPLGNIQRPRRAWESILWFSKSNKPFCNPKANGNVSNRIGLESKKGVGDYKAGVSSAKKGIARCRDYVEVGTGATDKSKYNHHPAQYPQELASWIIKLLCPQNGTVVDPFLGSGTTLLACNDTKTNGIGIELCQDYCEIAKKRLEINKVPFSTGGSI